MASKLPGFATTGWVSAVDGDRAGGREGRVRGSMNAAVEGVFEKDTST